MTEPNLAAGELHPDQLQDVEGIIFRTPEEPDDER